MPKPMFAYIQRRGLSREEATFYVGVSANTFDSMVADGRMPRAKRIGARKVWDRFEIDVAMESLPVDGEEKSGASWEGV